MAFNDIFKVTKSVIISEDLEKTNNAFTSSCANIVVSPALPDSSFPKTITIDFGTHNCTDIYGITRRGKLIVNCSGRYRDAGTVISISTDEYHVNNYKIEGDKTITNEGFNNNNNTYFTSNIIDGVINYPNGDLATFESNRIMEWVIGESSDGILGILDDEYDITGTSTGTNRNGRKYNATITSPLRLSILCNWVKQGTLELQPENLYSRIVDFGDGSCNSEIMVDINDNIYTIDSP
jgi:hypothetical protein